MWMELELGLSLAVSATKSNGLANAKLCILNTALPPCLIVLNQANYNKLLKVILIVPENRDIDCQTEQGQNYRGLTRCTTDESPCASWVGSPHEKWYRTNVGSKLPPNLCRNPSPDSQYGVWCYVGEKFDNHKERKKQYCSVRRCSYTDKGIFSCDEQLKK